ncbi:MAG: ArsI/CadI family heavy metal resistance metalloenzyme [Cyanobacteria bacterium P01_H01_bin.153]
MAAFKTHIALHVANLERAISFYRVLFDAQPAKHKADYAKFDIDNPRLNLTLNVSDHIGEPGLSHFGIQVDSTEGVQAAIARFQAAGLATFAETDTDCCYALQDKVWVTDPDQNRWEIFVIKVADVSPEINLSAAPARSCCP